MALSTHWVSVNVEEEIDGWYAHIIEFRGGQVFFRIYERFDSEEEAWAFARLFAWMGPMHDA